jgi:type II secretory pathway pseudopilin PulG
MLAVIAVLAALAGLLIPRLRTERDAHQQQQAGMAHAELALVAAGSIVGDESE